MSACPECREFNSKVLDTRKRLEDGWVHRQRLCLSCGERWETVEVPADDVQQGSDNETPTP